MKGFFHLTINGEPHRIEGDSINGTLLEYLREKRLTGAKEGCAEGECGACSVVVLDKDAQGRAAYRCVNSCLTLLPMLADRHVVTVEGLASNGTLHPAQSAFAEHFGSQCGFCTAGVVMSLFESYYREDFIEKRQVTDQLCGNLCRCTGYGPMRDAAIECVREARRRRQGESGPRASGPPPLDDPFRNALRAPFPEASDCEYVDRFDGRFYRPLTVTELFRMRVQYPDARLVAGATSVVREAVRKGERFRCLISLEGISELKAIVRHNGYWEIGAGVTLTQLEEGLEHENRAFDEALRRSASRQIRNRATVGGILAGASPASDLAPLLIALESAVRILSPEGEREVPIDRFFTGSGETILREDEIVKDVRIPRDVRARISRRGLSARLCQWYKVSKRREMDEGIVVSCFAVGLDGEKKIVSARLAYGGVAPTAARARKTEAFLEGKSWEEETLSGALQILGGEFDPPGDELASAAYRSALVAGLFERFYREFAAGEEMPRPLGAELEFLQPEPSLLKE